ncbi:hypothetical protein WA026_004152 [Henosepilachna vigintioctopunctata]|uniref:Uncharacterized protein n=1 Tax=Henosepilachna vigintioctopunctata TaxID=420089 RepID=A0AAW1UIR0_9CUCU
MELRRPVTISFIVLAICHVIYSEDFFTDNSKFLICNTEEYYDSIRKLSKDYRSKLCLTNENLLALPKNCFNQLPNMESIDLSGLFIQELSSNAFSGLSNVRQINLQRNNISKISRNVLDQLPTLELLDLSYNK